MISRRKRYEPDQSVDQFDEAQVHAPGCSALCGLRLAARVHDMRSSGINVVDRWVERDDTRFKAYKIIGTQRVADGMVQLCFGGEGVKWRA